MAGTGAHHMSWCCIQRLCTNSGEGQYQVMSGGYRLQEAHPCVRVGGWLLLKGEHVCGRLLDPKCGR
jgi:hypothetical protein